jgi:hypothetical protein
LRLSLSQGALEILYTDLARFGRVGILARRPKLMRYLHDWRRIVI